MSEHDRRYIAEAIRAAKRRAPGVTSLVFDFIERLLLKQTPAATPEECDDRAPVHREVPADHQPGRGEGHRRHGAVRVQPAAVAERGRRRSDPLRPRAVGGARAGSASGSGSGRRRFRPRRRTTPSAARTSARGSTCCRRFPDAWKAAALRWRALNRRFKTRGRRRARARPERGVSALSDARRRLAVRRRRERPRRVRRAHLRVHDQGAARGEGPHQLAQSRRGVRSGRSALRRGDSRSAPAAPFLDAFVPVSGAGRRARHLQQPRAARSSRSPRPAFPISTRAPSCGTSTSSIRTTAARSTTPIVARSWTRSTCRRDDGRSERWRRNCSHSAATAGSRCSSRHERSRRAGASARRSRGEYLPLQTAGARKRRRCSRSRGVDGSEYAITCVPRLIASVDPRRGRTAARRRLARYARRVACRRARRHVSRCADRARRSTPNAAPARVVHDHRRGGAVRTASRSPCWLRLNGIPHDHRRRLHRLADPGDAVRAAHPLPHRGADRSAQRSLHPRARVDLQHDARSAQQDRDLHQRPGVLPGDARRHPARARKRSTWSATSSGRARSPISSSRRCASGRAPASQVTIVLDAIGSFGIFRRRRRSGCATPAAASSGTSGMSWYSLSRLNNRTHRELLVVDGRVAFVGGAGVADWWCKPTGGKPMWRDMMARIEGPVVSNIQGVVAENWLECCGEILTSAETYQPHREGGHEPGVRDQELAVGSRDRLARALPDARGVGHLARADLDAVLSAGQGVPAGVRAHGPPRRRDHGHRAGRAHRSALGAAGQPAHVRRCC